MALIGRFHPLLIHFPIALVIVAAMAEGLAAVTHDARWSTVAVNNVRAGAVFALIAAVAGWWLAATLRIDPTPLLAWHRWLGTAGAGATLAAAFSTWNVEPRPSKRFWTYRIALVGAAALVAAAGHLGGLLVWGADFLRP
jgi:uncharacterized membrane protein